MRMKIKAMLVLLAIGIIVFSGCVEENNGLQKTENTRQRVMSEAFRMELFNLTFSNSSGIAAYDGVTAKVLDMTKRPRGVVHYEEKIIYVTRINLSEKQDVISMIFIVNKSDLGAIAIAADDSVIAKNFRVGNFDNKNILLADIYLPMTINRTFISTRAGNTADEMLSDSYQSVSFIESANQAGLREDPMNNKNDYYMIAIAFTIAQPTARDQISILRSVNLLNESERNNITAFPITEYSFKSEIGQEKNSSIVGSSIGFTYKKPAPGNSETIDTLINSIKSDRKTANISARKRPLMKIDAGNIADHEFLGWSFNGDISRERLQREHMIKAFSPVEYMYLPGETSTITAVYENINTKEIKLDNITINWE